MSLFEKLGRMFEPPEVQVRGTRCLECGARPTAHADACPECGGEVEEVDRSVEYTYWGLYQ